MSYDTGVNAATEKEAIVHVGHHALLDGLGKGFADFLVRDGVSRIGPWLVVILW